MLVPVRPLFVAASLALLASCVTPGHVRAVKTADRLEELRSALEELRGGATATSNALSALLAQRNQDAALAFQRFEESVQALESARRRSESRMQGVRVEADAYFLRWKEQAATIEDEDLKESSEDRRVKLAEAVAGVEKSLQPAHEAVDAYLASLRDTLKYLSIDLTPPAIAAIEGRTKAAAKSVKSIHDKVADALEQVEEAAPLFAVARASAVRQQPAPAEPATN